MNIKPNLHNLDRLVRIIIGIACIYIGFVDSSFIVNPMVSILVGIFGIVNIFAAAISVAGLSIYPNKFATDNE